MKIESGVFKRYRPYTRLDVRRALAKAVGNPGPVSAWARQRSIRAGKGPGWVFFSDVTGKKGRTVFPEKIDVEGIYTWVSVASQGPSDPAVKAFAVHDEKKADVLLFGRGLAQGPFYYLGKLKFIAIEPGKGRPVRLRWRILDFDPSAADLSRMRIVLAPEGEKTGMKRRRASLKPRGKSPQKTAKESEKAPRKAEAAAPRKLEGPARAGKPPEPVREGRDIEARAVMTELGAGRVAQTRKLRLCPSPWGTSASVAEPEIEKIVESVDREPKMPDAERYRMELAVETMVVERERGRLVRAGRPDLADRVAQSLDEGAHPGYDVLSFDPATGAEIPIAVKATTGDARAPFFLSASELDCMERSAGRYRIYRVYGFDFFKKEVDFYLMDMPIIVWGAAVYSG